MDAFGIVDSFYLCPPVRTATSRTAVAEESQAVVFHFAEIAFVHLVSESVPSYVLALRTIRVTASAVVPSRFQRGYPASSDVRLVGLAWVAAAAAAGPSRDPFGSSGFEGLSALGLLEALSRHVLLARHPLSYVM